jgi:hypothetical protein
MDKHEFYRRSTEHLMWQASARTIDNHKKDNCVYFAIDTDGAVAVTDSRNRNKVLWFTPDEWNAFTEGIRDNCIRFVP